VSCCLAEILIRSTCNEGTLASCPNYFANTCEMLSMRNNDDVLSGAIWDCMFLQLGRL
jgi:hypothetical protein